MTVFVNKVEKTKFLHQSRNFINIVDANKVEFCN